MGAGDQILKNFLYFNLLFGTNWMLRWNLYFHVTINRMPHNQMLTKGKNYYNGYKIVGALLLRVKIKVYLLKLVKDTDYVTISSNVPFQV